MEIQLLLLPTSLLSLCTLIIGVAAVASAPSLAKPNCSSHCGSVEIPFPFGIGPSCYHNINKYDHGFEILCDNSTNPPKPLLNISSTSQPEVLDISLSGTLRINNPIFFSGCSHKRNYPQLPNLGPTPFDVSEKNKFTAVSCGRVASLQTASFSSSYNTSYRTKMAVCLSICIEDIPVMANNTCDGINCCQTSIPFGTYDAIHTSFEQPINDTGGSKETCKYAFLVDPEWFTSNSTNTSTIVHMDYVPIVLKWRFYKELVIDKLIGGAENSTEDNMNRNCDSEEGPCSCAEGYNGNPYLRGGCKDINECKENPNICANRTTSTTQHMNCYNTPGDYFCYSDYISAQHRPLSPIKLAVIVICSVLGLVFVIIGTWWLHQVMKKNKNKRRKKMFYIQNGGLLLEEMLSSGEVNVEKIKVFEAKDLEKATDRFNVDRILGEGGQGTVYKGMLTDGRIVAVKKSKVIDGGDVSQFINEIVILSQINHRNVVKILGCCLESEVPLLVYEFLPNGTLSQYIQSRDADFPLTWDVRLQVSLEVAGALSYLHSSASMPIYHRDIKSSNILLDEKYRAKVADFGTSRSVSIEKTHLTMTHVNGTYGYLDPEYFQSNQFSDKSDVYSFGVILAELLSGEKPLSLTRSRVEGKSDGRSLATYFMDSIEDNCLFDILDVEVLKGAKKSEIMVMANLAKRCLNMKGKKRPSMKEVTLVLEGILMSKKSLDVEHIAEVEYEQAEIAETWDVGSSSIGPQHLYTNSSFEVQSLLSFKSQ